MTSFEIRPPTDRAAAFLSAWAEDRRSAVRAFAQDLTDEDLASLPVMHARLLKPGVVYLRERRIEEAVYDLKRAWNVLTDEWLAAA